MFDHSKQGERTGMKPRCIATSPIGGSLPMGEKHRRSLKRLRPFYVISAVFSILHDCRLPDKNSFHDNGHLILHI
jgi:hypothetical protein